MNQKPNLEQLNKELPMLEGKLNIENLQKELQKTMIKIRDLEVQKAKLMQYGAEIQALIRYAQAGKIGFKD